MGKIGKNGVFDVILTVILAILIIGIVGTSGFLIFKYYEKFKINSDADNFLNEFDKALENQIPVEDVPNDEQNAVNEQQPAGDGGTRGIFAEGLKYKNYDVAGKIEMPSVRLQYPVLDKLTDANALEVSVAIQYGVGLNKVGNTVIIGHNYRSGLFFGSNKNMKIGDRIFITDTATGIRREYEIYNKYTTEERDTSYYDRNTNGKREVSLVTCQNNNAYRLVIWAREV